MQLYFKKGICKRCFEQEVKRNMSQKRNRSFAMRKIALATAVFVLTSVGSGVYAATEHWNDASQSADSASWTQWKTDWETIKDDYEQVSLTPGADETELNFAWYSHEEETPKVRISKTKNGLKSAKEHKGTQEATNINYSETLKESLSDGTYMANKVTVTGIKENSRYYYQVYQNGAWQDVETYRANDFDNYSVLYVADPQIGACSGQTGADGKLSGELAARNDAYNWNEILNETAEQHEDLSFMISAGDQVNTAGNEYEYAGYLYPEAMDSLPSSNIIGNHDSGNKNYSWHFNNPNSFNTDGSQSAYTDGHTTAGSDYYFTYGDVLYISIDTNNYNCATHENVIKKAVDENKDCKWRVVIFHQDIYGSGADHSDSDGMVLRTQLTPLMDEYDIDVVLQGHDHTYSRSYQLTSDGKEHKEYNNSNYRGDEDYQKENLCYNLTSTAEDGNTLTNPEGTVYFEQNSATGSKFYELIAEQQNFIAERSQTWTPTYSVMNVNDNRLSITTYDASTGEQLENSSTYTIIKEEKTPTAPAKETYDISKAVVSGIKDKTYNGKKQTQSITVRYNGKTLTANKDYTVSYSNNKKMGTASVTITGQGEYTGTIKKTFKIRPKKPVIMARATKNQKAVVRWKKVTGANGYRIYTAAKKNGKFKPVKTIKKGKTLRTTIKNLKKGNRYIKVRAYRNVNGKKVFSAYSTVKRVKVR